MTLIAKAYIALLVLSIILTVLDDIHWNANNKH